MCIELLSRKEPGQGLDHPVQILDRIVQRFEVDLGDIPDRIIQDIGIVFHERVDVPDSFVDLVKGHLCLVDRCLQFGHGGLDLRERRICLCQRRIDLLKRVDRTRHDDGECDRDDDRKDQAADAGHRLVFGIDPLVAQCFYHQFPFIHFFRRLHGFVFSVYSFRFCFFISDDTGNRHIIA